MFFTVYKGHEIVESGDNFKVKLPNGEYMESALAATITTAKKWIDASIIETQNKERKRHA